MLTAHNVDLFLSGARVLQDVSAQFERGKITVILGPNGAGKSSLIGCLAGLHRIGAGTVMVDDAPIQSLSNRGRSQIIGLLPQSGEVNWDILVRDLVALGRLPHTGRHGLSNKDEAIVDAAMSATKCQAFANRNIASLSGGERARVLLARVIAGEPEWLLADEPLANLDPAHQLDILQLLKTQAERGVGVVAVLHDLDHAARVADHIIILKNGVVAQYGRPKKVLTKSNLAAVYGIECTLATGADGTLSVRIDRRASCSQQV